MGRGKVRCPFLSQKPEYKCAWGGNEGWVGESGVNLNWTLADHSVSICSSGKALGQSLGSPYLAVLAPGSLVIATSTSSPDLPYTGSSSPLSKSVNFGEPQFHHLHIIESIDNHATWVIVKIILKEVPGKNKMLVLLWIIDSKMLVIRRCAVILNTTKEGRKKNPVNYTVAHPFLIL